jgi:hypothetical protein
LIYA